MANRVRGEVEVELWGEKYTLRLDHDAIANLEDALGYGLINLGQRLSDGKCGYREIVAIIHAALPEDTRKQVGLKKVGEMILDGGLYSYFQPATQLLRDVLLGCHGLGESQKGKKEPKAGK